MSPVLKAGPLMGVLVLVLSAPVVGLAQEDGDSLENIVVTASRLARPEKNLAQSVNIIDAAAIGARQPASVTELLRQIPGVNVVQQGGRGSITSLIIRGGEPNFTVVLIDGVKVNDSTNTRGGSYDFTYLDLSSIDRIEIVRGPMSAVYGSDALAGVVNIITNRGEPATAIRAEVGGQGRLAANVSAGGALGNVSGEISAHALEEGGDIEGADYKDRGMDGWARLPVGADGEVGLVWRYQDAESTSFPEESGGPEFAVIRDTDQRDVSEMLGRVYLRKPIAARWMSDISLSRYDRDEQSRSPGIAPGVFDGVPPVESDTDFIRDQFVASLAGAISGSASLVVGGEWQREDGASVGTIDFGFPIPTDFQLERETISAFTEIEWLLQSLVIQASLRWDNPQHIDDELSAQFGAVYSFPGDRGDLLLNWGEGFKAPSFFALGHPLVGNPLLLPETADSIDLGYRKRIADSVDVEFSVFRNEFENLIDFDPVLFTSVNRSRVVTRGVEAAVDVTLGDDVTLHVHGTYMEADIKDSDARLRARPHWRGGLVAEWQLDDRWLFTGSLLSMDEFYDVSIPTGGLFLDGYARLDLALSFYVSEHLTLGFAIDNALDSEYYEAIGFPAAGVRGRVNAAYQF